MPAVAMLTFQGIQNHQEALRNLGREAEYAAYQIATFSKQTIPKGDQYLANLATVPELQQAGPACDEFLASTLKSSYSLDNLVIISPNGDITCSGVPLSVQLNVSDRGYFKRALESKAFSVGELQFSQRHSRPLIVFAYPALDKNGNVARVLALAVDLSWLNESLSQALKSSTRFANVHASAVDSVGNIIAAAPFRQTVGDSVLDWDQIHAVVARDGALTRKEIWLDGITRTTSYLPLYSSNAPKLFLRIGVPLAGPLATVQYRSARNFSIVAIGSLLALAAAWSLSNWLVVRPIGILNRTATKLGQGQLSARTGLGNSAGEIGFLARQFDNMAEQLQRQHDALLRTARVQAVRSATNSAMLRANTEKGLLDDICRVVREIGGYELAWVGYAPQEASGTLLAQARSGADDELMASFCHTHWNEKHPDAGPVTKAIRSKSTQVFQDLSIASTKSPWRVQAAARGCASAIGLPLQVENTVIGALGIFSTDPHAFGPDEIQLLTATATDVSFGISALRTTNEVRRSQEFLGLVVNNIPSMVYVKDIQDLRFVSLNPAGEAFTGFREEDIIGKTDYDLFPREQADYFVSKDREALDGSGRLIVVEEPITARSGEMRILQTKKLSLLDAQGKPKYVLGISEDITEQKKINEQLVYLATHDALTGLPNRGYLMEQLARAVSDAQRNARPLAVLYLDLDGFKEINDTLGHSTGDEALKTVASLLKVTVPEITTIARVGGDEFVLVLEHASAKSLAAELARRLKRCFQVPINAAGREIFLTPSIGVSVFPDDGDQGETLLRTADIAMYRAKSEGRNTCVHYSPDLEAQMTERLEMRNLLRHAVDRNELVLHFQPKVSMQTGKIIGAEALIRWNSAERGLISPAQFIPLAEESGQIIPIGEWVLRTACAQAMQWRRQGLPPLVIAVNLSPRQFRQADLLERIQQTLDDTGLHPEYLELEVTESAIMDNAASAIRLLNDIHDMGVNLAIDDFGTGYSSLAYLKQLPVSILKIDQSFVKGLTSEADDAAIVTAVIAMAKSLNLSVTAEGVETQEQLDALAQLGCDNYQGYLFSRPVTAEAFTAMLGRYA